MANPSNAEIMNEIKSFRQTQSEHQRVLSDHEKRIRKVENFQIAYEAASKALSEARGPKNGVNRLNQDFVNVVLKFIALLTALVGFFYLIVQALITAH